MVALKSEVAFNKSDQRIAIRSSHSRQGEARNNDAAKTHSGVIVIYFQTVS